MPTLFSQAEGGTCTHGYPSGTTIALDAAPHPGFVFAGWSGAACVGSTCTVTMNADQNLTARFTTPASLRTPTPVASCTITLITNKVILVQHRKGKGTTAKPGTVTLRVRCNESATVTVTGRLIENVGKKQQHRKQRTRQFTFALGRTRVSAGKTKTITLMLPSAARDGLKHRAKESVSFTLTATNANGTSRATTKSTTLKPA